MAFSGHAKCANPSGTKLFFVGETDMMKKAGQRHLVDRMLELHKKKNSLPLSAEREKIEREIAVTDEKIDEIVYGLYGITDEERKIIEA